MSAKLLNFCLMLSTSPSKVTSPGYSDAAGREVGLDVKAAEEMHVASTNTLAVGHPPCNSDPQHSLDDFGPGPSS